MSRKGKRIRRFDFSKQPVKPCFLMTLAKWIICWPDLEKRNFTYKKINMEGVTPPFLLLSNHCSMVDFNVMLKLTHPYKVNNVMTLEGFRDYTEPLMRSLGVLGTRKFVTDMYLVKNIKYCIDKLKTIFVLFPEARYSLDGCTSYLPDSLGKLVKLLNVPVVVLQIHGNFITAPQWNKINKKTHVEAVMTQILTPEQIKGMTVDEINAGIRESFQYDDFAWQRENKIKISHPLRANGLHSLLYKCPSCLTEGKMDSEGVLLWCNHCGKSWAMDEYGRLEAVEGETEFSHIPDWSNWERECVREEIQIILRMMSGLRHFRILSDSINRVWGNLFRPVRRHVWNVVCTGKHIHWYEVLKIWKVCILNMIIAATGIALISPYRMKAFGVI